VKLRSLFPLVAVASFVSCAKAGTIANTVVTVAGDVCKLVAQDDPTEPQWAQVACVVEGIAGPVVVSLPWSSWVSAQGQTAASALAAAKVKVQRGGAP
jgi:hypothetical protein